MSLLTNTARNFNPFRQPFETEDSHSRVIVHDEDGILEDNQQKMQRSFNQTILEANERHKPFVRNIKFHHNPEVRKTHEERTGLGYHPLMLSEMIHEVIEEWERSQRRPSKAK